MTLSKMVVDNNAFCATVNKSLCNNLFAKDLANELNLKYKRWGLLVFGDR